MVGNKIAGGAGVCYESHLEASRHLLISRQNHGLPPGQRKGILWQMKLRTDLLEQLTAADILKEAAANQHRYKAEPSFSKTGVGHLSPRSMTDSANEAVRSEALTRKLTRRLKKNGNAAARPS